MIKQLFRTLHFLSKDQIVSYNKVGYLCLPNMIPLTDIAALKRRAHEHIDAWRPEKSLPSSSSEFSSNSSAYFFDSSYKVSFFVEKTAQFPFKDKHKIVNKIGHAIHDLDNLFRAFSYRQGFKDLLDDLGYENPKIVQSQYIIKLPKIGGGIRAYQNSSYVITEPPSCIGLWVALDDAKVENSCMYVVPGSHKNGTHMFWERKNGALQASNNFQYSTRDSTVLEVKAGTVIVVHGDLVHWSEQNLSDTARHAYFLDVVEGNSKWSENNWIQRPEYFPFREWDEAN
jgi:phytanoyl-CoA hydroxylase